MLLQQFGLSQYAGFEFVGGQVRVGNATEDGPMVLDSLTGGSGGPLVYGDTIVLGWFHAESVSAAVVFDGFDEIYWATTGEVGDRASIYVGKKIVSSSLDSTIGLITGPGGDAIIQMALVFRGPRDIASDVESTAGVGATIAQPAEVTIHSLPAVVVAFCGNSSDDGAVRAISQVTPGAGETAYEHVFSGASNDAFRNAVFAGAFFVADNATEKGAQFSTTQSANTNARSYAVTFALGINL